MTSITTPELKNEKIVAEIKVTGQSQ